MTASLLHGEAVASHHPGEEVCGVITFGGTESLINPMLVYRERGRVEKGISEPEVIVPITAHVALQKAAHMLDIELIQAPVGDDWRADVAWMREHVTPNTIAHRRLGRELSARPHRSDRGDVGPRARARPRPARRRLHGRLHPALGGASRLSDPDLRLPGARGHVASPPTRTSTATRSRARRCCSTATARCAATSTSATRLARRHLHVAGALRQPLGRDRRRGLGGDAQPRRSGLPGDRGAHLRDCDDHPRRASPTSPSSR